MDILEFQNKLEDLCNMAKVKNNVLHKEQIREHFQNMGLEKSQLLKVLQYLKGKGIMIEGLDEPEPGSSAAEDMAEKIPLTEEEQAYLKEYRASLNKTMPEREELEKWFQALFQGDENARTALIQAYLPAAADIAVDLNCNEIYLADLIQEANLGLLAALGQETPLQKDDLWLRNEIRRSVNEAVREQTDRKIQDDCLVAKVQNLESAIRELTENDEDSESKFSIDELAVILDMDVEEIRDVLRLTGDDK